MDGWNLDDPSLLTFGLVVLYMAYKLIHGVLRRCSSVPPRRVPPVPKNVSEQAGGSPRAIPVSSGLTDKDREELKELVKAASREILAEVLRHEPARSLVKKDSVAPNEFSPVDIDEAVEVLIEDNYSNEGEYHGAEIEESDESNISSARDKLKRLLRKGK